MTTATTANEVEAWNAVLEAAQKIARRRVWDDLHVGYLVSQLVPRNARLRNIICTALRLAALPSRELDALERAARDAWRKAEDATRELRRIHGPLPPHPCESWPVPDWATPPEGARHE